MTHKMFSRMLVAAAAACATGTAAFAQSSASQTTTGSATIFQPITLAKNTDLVFGIIVRPTSGSGTVAVSTAGARTITGNGALLSDEAASAATFTANGEGGQTFSINVPASLSMAGPASITVASTTTNGAYSGSFTTTVSYN
jgi:Domain of unknown function (DUF4402)